MLDLGRLPSGARVAVKLESLQRSGSFKIRGAFNRILRDSAAHRRVAAASGGNHGAAVACAGHALGLQVDVFVPATAPAEKVRRIAADGGAVHLVEGPFPNAAAECATFAAREDALLIHPFDDPDVVAGQGTVGLEILEQLPEATKIVVAVGGGGFAAGVAIAGDGRAELVPVEPELSPTLARARAAGQPVEIAVGGVAADSLGAPRLGDIAFSVLREGHEVVLVAEQSILAAQRRLWDELRLAVEPAAACAWAALDEDALRLTEDDVVVVVLCGGNVDPGGVEWNA
jgi:threonine dehydratase